MLYTTYYGNINNIPEDAIVLSISRLHPKWLDRSKYPNILALSPSYDLLMSYKCGTISLETLREKFTLEVLHEDNTVLSNLAKQAIDNDIYLLCYEKDATTCHRTWVAEWLRDHYNIEWREVLYV